MTVLSWQKQADASQRKKLEQLQSQFQAKAAMVASLEAQYLQRQQDFSRQQKSKQSMEFKRRKMLQLFI